MSFGLLLAGVSCSVRSAQPTQATPQATQGATPSTQAEIPFWTTGGLSSGAVSSKRATRQANFAARQDSLVTSRDYQFIPVSMYALPGGSEQATTALYYYLSLDGSRIQIHLPTLRGEGLYPTDVLNFDATTIDNYQAQRTPFGWSITFSVWMSSATKYSFGINFFTATSEAILNMVTPYNTIKYVGSLTRNQEAVVSPSR